MSGSGHQNLWTEPKYPGDAVVRLCLKRGSEVGEVVIQHYGEQVRAACFLPGVVECSPGDTPKTWPEYHSWHVNNFTADEAFDNYVQCAYDAGWSRTYKEEPNGKSA